jgi:hypothetical protein
MGAVRRRMTPDAIGLSIMDLLDAPAGAGVLATTGYYCAVYSEVRSNTRLPSRLQSVGAEVQPTSGKSTSVSPPLNRKYLKRIEICLYSDYSVYLQKRRRMNHLRRRSPAWGGEIAVGGSQKLSR